MYEIGMHNFVTVEAFQAIVAAHVISDYDVSPERREEHDRKVREKVDKGIGRYMGVFEWARFGGGYRLHHITKPKHEIQKGEKVMNPWVSLLAIECT
jgi:hypothetical protein